MKVIRRRAHARAGLIGNPSDGYGGKTIAFTIQQFAAEVVLYPWEHLEIIWSKQDRNRFESIEALVDDVNLNGYYGGVRLIKATIKRFADFCRDQRLPLDEPPFSVRYTTNIPRGVGLAGSSAIVVATLRCLLDYYQLNIPTPLQASFAHSVENDEIGIACGYQDRVAQVYEGLVYMDFSHMQSEAGLAFGDYAPVDTTHLPPLYVAYDLAASKNSGSVHGPLRARLRENARLADTMNQIAELTPQARQAIEQTHVSELEKLINRNFELRCQLYDVPPEHLGIVRAARAAGVPAKFAGSGGAIVGTYRDEAAFKRLKRTLGEADSSWKLIRPRLVRPAAQRTDPLGES